MKRPDLLGNNSENAGEGVKGVSLGNSELSREAVEDGVVGVDKKRRGSGSSNGGIMR